MAVCTSIIEAPSAVVIEAPSASAVPLPGVSHPDICAAFRACPFYGLDASSFSIGTNAATLRFNSVLAWEGKAPVDIRCERRQRRTNISGTTPPVAGPWNPDWTDIHADHVNDHSTAGVAGDFLIQSGVQTLANGVSTATLTLPTDVDIDKTFLRIHTAAQASSDHHVSGELVISLSVAKITFTRGQFDGSSDNAVDIYWQTVTAQNDEFDVVLRTTVSFGAADDKVTTAHGSIAWGRAFANLCGAAVSIAVAGDHNDTSASGYFTAEDLTNTSTRLQRGLIGTLADVVLEIVEFNSSYGTNLVQSLPIHNLSGDTTSGVADMTANHGDFVPIRSSRTWTYVQYKHHTNNLEAVSVSAEQIDNRTLQFRRGDSSSYLSWAKVWFIEFPLSLAQTRTDTALDTDLTEDTDIYLPLEDTDDAFQFLTSNTAGAGTALTRSLWAPTFIDTDTVRATRRITGFGGIGSFLAHQVMDINNQPHLLVHNGVPGQDYDVQYRFTEQGNSYQEVHPDCGAKVWEIQLSTQSTPGTVQEVPVNELQCPFWDIINDSFSIGRTTAEYDYDTVLHGTSTPVSLRCQRRRAMSNAAGDQLEDWSSWANIHTAFWDEHPLTGRHTILTGGVAQGTYWLVQIRMRATPQEPAGYWEIHPNCGLSVYHILTATTSEPGVVKQIDVGNDPNDP